MTRLMRTALLLAGMMIGVAIPAKAEDMKPYAGMRVGIMRIPYCTSAKQVTIITTALLQKTMTPAEALEVFPECKIEASTMRRTVLVAKSSDLLIDGVAFEIWEISVQGVFLADMGITLYQQPATAFMAIYIGQTY